MTWNELKKKLNSTESIVSLVLGIIVVVTAGILVLNFVRSKMTVSKEPVQVSQEANVPGVPVGSKMNEAPTNLPAQHKVTAGEDLWSIALKYYKSGYNWVTIAQANNLTDPNLLSIDQELLIPKADPIFPEGSLNGGGISVAAITGNKYKVVKGDNLWTISCLAYADCYKWTEIAKANNLTNADVIEVGQELSLPR